MLLTKLKALIRVTPKGRSYESALLDRIAQTFLTDMCCVVTTSFLAKQDDTSLTNIYWAWERTAIKFPEFEARIQQLMTNTKILLILPTEEATPTEETNVVNLFQVH